MKDPKEILNLIKLMTPRVLPRLKNLSKIDFSFTNVHDKGINPNAKLTSNIRYEKPSTYPLGAENAHGEIETINNVEAIHWYNEADGVLWHFVTAGNPENTPLVFVHGFPESWYTFHNQIENLSDEFYCIAVDTLGNGQSDKRLDLDYCYSGIATSLVKMLNNIGVHEFNLAGHDRGSVICDHLLNVENTNNRVLRYIRMQQSANEPHGEPKPPHNLFASPWFPKLMKWTGFPRLIYAASAYHVVGISKAVLNRLDYECKYKGIAEACPRQFMTTGFEQELNDRHDFLFAKMTMPVLFLQGNQDPGQHPEEYEKTPEFVKNGSVKFIDGNHFFQLSATTETSKAIREFLNQPTG